tara:strand:- start:2707 stop:3951 length:1245 start_codon:yes stop_codon:yes gene_type:complete
MRFLPLLLRKAIKVGGLTLYGPHGYRESFGSADQDPQVSIEITDPSLDWRIFLNPELKGAEAYMAGSLVVREGGAYEFLRLIFLNKRHFDLSASQVFWNKLNRKLRRFMQHNPLARARRNVGHHYDLGNDFYRLWLDEDLQYSCGYFPSDAETLAEAQREKKRHVAAKLALQSGQRVLDIGCGWGGLALYLARVADVEVTGVTLSKAQLAVARQRAAAAGLDSKVRFELCDYRSVTGRFDRVVSVGMLEHVGVGHLETYFRTVRDRLAPGGVALIHSISTKAPPGITGPFIRKHIFPGGYAPCISEASLAIERSGLWMLDCEIWRLHYAKTLRLWRERFLDRRQEVVDLYDERFARMWEFYLAACECAFAFGSSTVVHYQLGRERDAVPLSRDYIDQQKQRLAKIEKSQPPRAS